MTSSKHPRNSRSEYSLIVHPADANSVGACFGGTIMTWMDMAASICARRHCNTKVNTVKAEDIQFLKPLRVGQVAHCVAKAVRVFQTSMEVHVDIFAEDTYNETTEHAASARFIFIGLDDNMKPVKISDLVPETEEEKQLWHEAGKRRLENTSIIGG